VKVARTVRRGVHLYWGPYPTDDRSHNRNNRQTQKEGLSAPLANDSHNPYHISLHFQSEILFDRYRVIFNGFQNYYSFVDNIKKLGIIL
jgi:hypothetical protein